MQVMPQLIYFFKFASLLVGMCFEYLLFAGVLYLFFYTWREKKYWPFKIQQRSQQKKHIIRDIKYSFCTLVVFGLVIVPVFWASEHGYTRIYHPIDKYGWGYYFFSILLMVFIHDTYFYWSHRFLHWKPMFRLVHKTHHLSLNPTVFSIYAFHPFEAFVNVLIIPIVAFTVPHHGSAITIFTLYQLAVNTMGHLGYEFFPKGFTRHKITKWSNTATHHNMHHRFVKCNYGLYFNFWDTIMKTNHRLYDETFDEVAGRAKKTSVTAKLSPIPAEEIV